METSCKMYFKFSPKKGNIYSFILLNSKVEDDIFCTKVLWIVDFKRACCYLCVFGRNLIKIATIRTKALLCSDKIVSNKAADD
jgi:hypothetical protein